MPASMSLLQPPKPDAGAWAHIQFGLFGVFHSMSDSSANAPPSQLAQVSAPSPCTPTCTVRALVPAMAILACPGRRNLACCDAMHARAAHVPEQQHSSCVMCLNPCAAGAGAQHRARRRQGRQPGAGRAEDQPQGHPRWQRYGIFKCLFMRCHFLSEKSDHLPRQARDNLTWKR